LCMCLCGCSDAEREVIWIGSEAESAAEKESAQSGNDYETLNTAEPDETIRVYVCGAVCQSGVVEIPAGSRVEAALEAAGGFAEHANRTYVNLAAWVSDGQMLYFPTQEEDCVEVPGETWLEVQTPGAAEQNANRTDLVNINTADVEKLCTLPGIGESRAADIITYRETNGFFETCEEIMCVPGIKEGLFERICDKITVE